MCRCPPSTRMLLLQLLFTVVECTAAASHGGADGAASTATVHAGMRKQAQVTYLAVSRRKSPTSL